MSVLKLSEMLPSVKGRYDNFSALSNKTWFGVGGPAEVLFTPANTDDLSYFFKEVDEKTKEVIYVSLEDIKDG